MDPQPSNRVDEVFYHTLPKVELHRHLEGSVRLQTLKELVLDYDLDMPLASLDGEVQVGENDPLTSANFLTKFQALRKFFRSQEVIHRITREAIADASADHVCYLELRFTPVALCRAEGFSLADAMDWVIESSRQAGEDFGIEIRLIASTNRHESPRDAEQVARLAADRMARGVVGIDLAGDEANYSAGPFMGIFREAKQAGLRITVHAGEWSGPQNVVEAIELLGAERIGHGVRVMEDPAAIALARDRQIPFEVCLTSNFQTGVIPSIRSHPLPQMIAAGLNVTINTDDPCISQIVLSDEYRLAHEILGIPMNTLRERVLAAAQAAFLVAEERQRLDEQIGRAFPTFIG